MNCIRSVLSIEIARCWLNLDRVNVCLCRLNLCQAHTSSPVPPLYIAQTSYQLHDQPASPYRCLNMAVHSQESITVSAIMSRVWSILNLYILYGMGNDWFANKFRCLTDLPPIICQVGGRHSAFTSCVLSWLSTEANANGQWSLYNHHSSVFWLALHYIWELGSELVGCK